jgi:hypothetical protein
MRISGDFEDSEWEALRTRLVAGEQAAWVEAVKLLDQRIRGRYLDHARRLLDERYSGFAVLAIDCAVIEALEQFRRGAPETPWKQSGAFFKAFLTQTRFKAYFTTDAMAGLFFGTIRCGILHQAEAKEDSLIKKGAAHPAAALSKSGAGLVINARRFHEELEGAFDDYKKILDDDTPSKAREEHRAAFIQKMDAIARRPTGVSGVVQPNVSP